MPTINGTAKALGANQPASKTHHSSTDPNTTKTVRSRRLVHRLTHPYPPRRPAGGPHLPNVLALQNHYPLAPLSAFTGTPAPPLAPPPNWPASDEKAAVSRDFIGHLNFLLQNTQPVFRRRTGLRRPARRTRRPGVTPDRIYERSCPAAPATPG